MAQKDISEKLLEDYDDVFADIVNVLLFDGEEIIEPCELEGTDVISHYKSDNDRMHEQERDVAKFWKRGGAHIALYGIENQTNIDRYMPLRIINYDGVAYRSQLLDKKIKEKYPVITLVLYFGEKRWKRPKSLIEVLNIPEKLKPYVSDYRINVYEIAYLTDKKLKMFKSDFGILADFFVNKRRNKNYIPKDERKFEHVDAMLKFLTIMLKDKIYETVFLDKKEGWDMTMSSFWDRARDEGRREGRKEGRKEVIENMIKKGFTDEQIMSACNITQKRLEEIKKEVFETV